MSRRLEPETVRTFHTETHRIELFRSGSGHLHLFAIDTSTGLTTDQAGPFNDALAAAAALLEIAPHASPELRRLATESALAVN